MLVGKASAMGRTVILIALIGVISLGVQLAITALRSRLDSRRRRRGRHSESVIDLLAMEHRSDPSTRTNPFIHLDLSDD